MRLIHLSWLRNIRCVAGRLGCSCLLGLPAEAIQKSKSVSKDYFVATPSQGTDRQTDRPSPNKHACCVTSCDAATLPTGKPESEYNQTRLRRTAAELGGPPVKQPSPVMKIAGHTSQQRQGFGKHQARAFSSGFSSAKKHRRQVEKQHGHLVATCTGHLSSVGGAARSSKRLPCSLDTPTIVHPAMQECKCPGFRIALRFCLAGDRLLLLHEFIGIPQPIQVNSRFTQAARNLPEGESQNKTCQSLQADEKVALGLAGVGVPLLPKHCTVCSTSDSVRVDCKHKLPSRLRACKACACTCSWLELCELPHESASNGSATSLAQVQ